MIREVLRYPDPRLKARADPQGVGPPEGLVADLVETMRSFPRCVGIAAPQIGV
ncbi:MAG: Polypeptide deformylase, partial [Solirubrobacteraceae bacterium]|nr:Polypeptide deformylase [Solirubrobacteraceae bacterium]